MTPDSVEIGVEVVRHRLGIRLSSHPKYSQVIPPGESITRGGHIWRMTTSGYGT